MMIAPVDRSFWMSPTTFYGLGIVVQTYPGLEVWTHSGGTQGSRSWFKRFSNGCSIAFLFNGEGSSGGDAFTVAMDNLLGGACLNTTVWPSADLFLQFLAPVAGAIVNGASFQPAPGAPDSLLTIFGAELSGTGSSSVSLRIRDSAGVEQSAPLVYKSLSQVNFRLPAGVAEGEATLVLKRAPHADVSVPLRITAVSPGLFASGVVTRVRADGSRSEESVTGPIRLPGPSEELYLTLYGTGIRGRRSGAVVLFDGKGVDADYAGAQPQFAGVDQVNVKLSGEVVHSGRVAVSVRGAGVESNSVSLVFE
jgi:uncharacterized protein (TIGR03437 family)